MKIRSLILLCMCVLLLVACGQGSAVSVQPTAEPVATEVPVTEAPTPEATPQQVVELVVPVITVTPTATVPPTPEPTTEPTPVPTATPVPKLGVLDKKFADKFVEGDPVATKMSYQSNRVAVFIERVEDDTHTLSKGTFVYYLADVYFQNMDDFRAGFCKNMDFKYKYEGRLEEIAKQYNAVFAITGDYSRRRDIGLVLRNGVVGRDIPDPERDVCVIYRDGSMTCYEGSDTPSEELLADENVWHIFCFGPNLLDENGQPKTEFNSKVVDPNHRCVIGYYEPGHYCFLFVQGDKKQSSFTGLSLVELSQFMSDLGCKKAYNLDGGGTACMYFNGKILNAFGSVTRRSHDIVYIPFQ